MIRLTDKNQIFTTLDDVAKNKKCYWRYQESIFGGTIPVGHRSHERMYEGEEPEYIEDGVSCYDNPYSLFDYMSNEYNDPDETDVVLFDGYRVGSGIDEEDIVEVTDESDILYSLSLRDFLSWTQQTDYVYEDFGGREHEFWEIELD